MEQITVHVKQRPYGKRLIISTIVGLLIGVSAATQAAMPNSLLTMLMYGNGSLADEPPVDPVFFAMEGSPSTEALSEDDEDDEQAGDTDGEEEQEETNVRPQPKSSVFTAFKNALTVPTQEPVVLIAQTQDAPRAFMYRKDLDAEGGDAKNAGGSDAGDGVDLAMDTDSNLPHIKQGEDPAKEKEKEPAMNVFSTSTYAAPPAQSAIPQVVQGNGSSYQNVIVNNIASTIISALQNINATTIVNLNQTCGDYCELNADVDANTDAGGDQDTDGSSTATTVVNQEGSGESTTTGSGSTSGT